MVEWSQREWGRAMQDAVRDAITDCVMGRVSGGWQENTITHKVLQALGTSEEVQWKERPFRCAWKAFKASGRFETANGDIAIKVTLRAAQGGTVVGTKYFEAKKLVLETGRYDAIDPAQLARMRHIPGHEVLLYALRRNQSKSTIVGDALCLPTPIAAMLHGAGARILHPAAHHFIEVFAQALLGRGLNFDPRQATAFDKPFESLEATPSFLLEASAAPVELDLEPVQAPRGYEELDDRGQEIADDFTP